MIGFIVGAVLFSVPTIYYRIKLKNCEKDKKQMINSQWKWQWEDWGE